MLALDRKTAVAVMGSRMSISNRNWFSFSTKRLLLLATIIAFLSSFVMVATNSAAAAVDSASIGGTLTRTNGAPSLLTDVAITRPDGSMVASTSTTSDGSYSIASLPPGDYRLKFSGAGVVTQWFGGGEDLATGAVIQVAEGELATASAVVRLGGVITGKVLDASGAPLAVAIGASGNPSVRSDYRTGVYTLRLTTEKPVKLRADTPKFSIWAGGAYSSQTSPDVQVNAEETVSDVDFRYPEVGRVSGKLTNSFGAPLSASAWPYVRDHGQVVPLTTSASRASKGQDYILSVPASLPVTVEAMPTYNHFDERYESAFLGGTTVAEDATFLTVAKDETRYGVDVALQGGEWVTGVVTDQSGEGIAGVTVTAFQGSTIASRATTSSSGGYALTGMGHMSLGDVRVRFTSGTTVEQWYNGVATQGEAANVTTFGSFGSNTNATLEHLPEYRLTNLAPPAISGRPSATGWVQAVPGEWSKEPTSREFWWYCDGQFTYNGGTTWTVGDRGCKEISVREVVQLAEHQSGAAFSAPVSVTAKSQLAVAVRERAGRVILKSSITTPGVRNPGGTLKIFRGTKQLAKYRVFSTPATESYTYRGRRGPQTFQVKYSGSNVATPASKKVRARVR